jgi:hypothetical protein
VNSNSNKFLGGGCVQFEVTPGEIKMSLVGYIQQLPNKSWVVIDFADVNLPVKAKQLNPTAEPSDPKKPDTKGATKGNTPAPKGESSPKGGPASENKKSGKNNQSNND